jgi:hypothetical protein
MYSICKDHDIPGTTDRHFSSVSLSTTRGVSSELDPQMLLSWSKFKEVREMA